MDHPLSANHVNLVQPLYGPRNRWITRATLRFDGGRPVTVKLGPSSRTAAGQTVALPDAAFTTLTITIDATNTGVERSYDGKSGVGFAEVRIPGQQVQEVLRMPEDLLSCGRSLLGVAPAHDHHDERDRLAGAPRHRSRDRHRPHLHAPHGPNLLGERDGRALVVGSRRRARHVCSAPRCRGSEPRTPRGAFPVTCQDRTSATLDGNPATVWSPGLGPQAGNWLDYDLDHPITFDHLSMAIVTDGRHSVPTSVTVRAGGRAAPCALPALADKAQPWATQNVSVASPR